MNERFCVKCGKELQPVKNEFLFLYENIIRTSDLYGCKSCNSYQIHGIPTGEAAIELYGKLNNTDDVDMVADPGNEKYWAILNPDLIFTEYFHAHMAEWYPDWRY